MKKFDGWLICSDIDGTLLNSEGELSETNRKAIEYFKENGGLFTVSTGRFPDFISGYNITPNAPIIAVNGTVLFDTLSNKLLYSEPLEKNYSDALEYLYKKTDAVNCVLVSTSEESYELFDRKNIADSKNFSIADAISSFDGKTVFKAVAICSSPEATFSLLKEMTELFSDRFHFCRSWPTGLELIKKGSGKGKCMRFLCSTSAKPIHTCIGAGDFENDISMLEDADIGCAVANALDCVKAAADVIIPTNDDNAIAYIIEQIENGNFSKKID